MIQIKDINHRQAVDFRGLTTVKLDKPEPHLVKADNVLFLSRGYRMSGMVIPDLQRNVVVSSYFPMLRPLRKRVKFVPEYLAGP